MPIFNNGVEGTNNGDKNYLLHRKPFTATFVTNLADMLQNRSMDDLNFSPSLHKDVHCRQFYSHVYDLLQRSTHGEATFMTVSFPFKSQSLGYIEGTELVAMTRFLDGTGSPNIEYYKAELIERSSSNDPLIFERQRPRHSAKDSAYIIQRHELHKDYKRLVKDPTAWAAQFSEEPDFDEVMGFVHVFHVMQPIVFDRGNEDSMTCASSFLRMLKKMNLKPITLPVILDLENKGLMCCSCDVYVHRCWCKHACGKALQRGIIRRYTPTMDPKPTIAKRVTAGALSKSRGGDALNVNG